MRDALTGVKQTEPQTDLESLYFDIDQITGRLFYTATGRGIIGVVSLPEHTTMKKIDVATTVEDILIHPADGNLYLRNRLGGSTIYRVDPNAGSLVRTVVPGNWPTKILLDAQRNRLYALSHYEAKVSLFDLVTDVKVMDIQLGTQRARTDALSTMVMNHMLGRLYVLMPELGTMTMVNADGSGSPLTVSIAGFDPSQATGPGKLHIAVNENLGRIFVFITDTKRLNIYDGSTPTLLSSSTISDYNLTVPPMNLLFSDDAGARLFVGPHIVDPTTGIVMGQIPSGKQVLAVHPSRSRYYVWDFTGQGFFERVYEYDSALQSILRRWDLSPIVGVYSAFGFDFPRGKMYAGYFDRGVVDVFNIGGPTGVEDFEDGNSISNGFTLYQNYPNPFNPITVINYQLPVSRYVTLKVFDLLGREVATLVNEELHPGRYSVQWEASGLPSGVYFYRLTAGAFVEMKKCMVLK